jgi:hypothetical protein
LIIELLMTKVDIKWNENNQAKWQEPTNKCYDLYEIVWSFFVSVPP